MAHKIFISPIRSQRTFVALLSLLCPLTLPPFADATPGTKPASPIRIDGSSTVYPIVEALAEEYRRERPDDEITIGVSGTGGGFKKFCGGELEIVTASRKMQPVEQERCARAGLTFRELPIATDAIVVVVHSGNTWAQCLTTDELRAIWQPAAQGKLTSWKQVRADFPDRPLTLYGPGTDSGTFDYFTEAIVGTAKQSRGDYTASEDDNVLVHGVANDPGALGYFSLAYYTQNAEKLKAVAVDHPAKGGEKGAGCIVPSVTTVRDGAYHPLSRALFLYVTTKSMEAEPVKPFIAFATAADRASLITEVGFVPRGEGSGELALRDASNHSE